MNTNILCYEWMKEITHDLRTLQAKMCDVFYCEKPKQNMKNSRARDWQGRVYDTLGGSMGATDSMGATWSRMWKIIVPLTSKYVHWQFENKNKCNNLFIIHFFFIRDLERVPLGLSPELYNWTCLMVKRCSSWNWNFYNEQFFQ